MYPWQLTNIKFCLQTPFFIDLLKTRIVHPQVFIECLFKTICIRFYKVETREEQQ